MTRVGDAVGGPVSGAAVGGAAVGGAAVGGAAVGAVGDTGRAVAVPVAGGGWREVRLREPRQWAAHPGPHRCRVAFAAVHVVADPCRANAPGAPAAIDWPATLAVRRDVASYGLGIAEAMDTAQRGMGLDWAGVRELVRASAAQARELGVRIAAGAGTDHAGDLAELPAVIDAYLEQVAVVQEAGAQVVLLASRQLARLARGPDDYLTVYGAVLGAVAEPVILHWLGEVFDPLLRGYWGSAPGPAGVPQAMRTVLDLVAADPDAVDGIKLSLLSAPDEIALRAALPAGVRLYTGDDFGYPELIRGDGQRHSDALLGAFAAVAPAASAALTALDAGDLAGYDAAMAATLPLARHLFAAPTYHYKTGIAFLSWLAGRQPGFTMLGGLQAARSVPHLAEVFTLANDAGLLPDPELAAHRLSLWLATCGVTPP